MRADKINVILKLPFYKDPISKFLLLTLWNISDKKNYCNITKKDLSKLCSIHPVTVREKINYLCSLGFIEKIPQMGKDGGSLANVYKLIPIK